MILNYVLLCALLASPVLGSAVKGRDDVKGGIKHLPSPIEQQKLVSSAELLPLKGVKLEQREELAEHKTDELQQQKEEVRIEESKGKRYEAKAQINLEELKSQQEQREDISLGKTRVEQQKQEDRFEQQQQHEFHQQRELDTQQIELKEEQRKLEEPLLIQQQVQLIETPKEIVQGTKTAYGAAPIGQAEPYSFSYQVEGSSRSESGDVNGVVRGQYTLQGADGSSRIVDYIADHNGFRAKVNTNEFGTESRSPASIALQSSQPLAELITLRQEGKTREDLHRAALSGGIKGEQQKPLSLESTKSAGTKRIIEEARPSVKSIKQESLSLGQKLIQQEELPVDAQLVEKHEQIKGELREPKTLTSDLKSAELRSGFTSATAHRQVQSLPRSRTQTILQREQTYPLSPALSYKRGPRVSFYNGGEDDLASFESPSALANFH